MRRFFIFLFLAFSFGLGAQAPSLSEEFVNPANVGFDVERLSMIDAHIDSYISEQMLPGGVFLIARKGEIVYHKSFGNRSTKADVAYHNDDIFRIASMTKAVTTVSIMQLYERGKLGLDDPVHTFIPAFKDGVVLDSFNMKDSTYTTLPAARPITIRHLLTHTSGIVYGGFSPGKLQIVYNQHGMTDAGLSQGEWSTEELIDRLAKVPLAFQPGEKYHYGLNMDVLGRVIEVVSGMSLDQYFDKHIFEPLDMVDTYFYVPEEKQDRIVPLYTYNPTGGWAMAEDFGFTMDYPTEVGRNYFAGGGGLSSTAMDYAKFIQSLVNQGSYKGRRILSRKTMEVMTSDQMIKLNKEGKGFANFPGLTYCLGFALYKEDSSGLNSKSPGTFEWGGYFNTKYFIDPAEDLIFVGMTQVLPFRDDHFWDRLYAMVYGAISD
ncbi:MAG: beta-lactamase family protein [Saprospiraceae bacterium]|nr:beta-lactamase family protein [Saprospiraceae bacterium]